jgi:2-haloacid dehalogenase
MAAIPTGVYLEAEQHGYDTTPISEGLEQETCDVRCIDTPGIVTNHSELYEPFSTVTRNSLTHALSEHGVALDSEATDKLMDAYNHLSAFPEVPAALDRVASDPTLAAVVFSNGTLDMVSSSVLKSQDLAPYSRVFDDMICVEAVQRFKPTRAVYGYLAERLGKEDMSEIWLITANPFDVVGAVHAGIKAAWVDRAGRGWIDAMDPDTKPTVVAADVNGALDAIQRALGK